MFRSNKSAGERVERNENLGSKSDPFGEYEKAVKAYQAGYIIGINYPMTVNKGDALFHIGVQKPEPKKPTILKRTDGVF
jgi:predicted deacylase